MFERIRIFARPGWLVAVALCLLFPLLWNRVFPVFEGEAVSVQLTAVRPNDAIEKPEPSTRALEKASHSRKNEQLIVWGFELERAGRYSVYGISSNRGARPLALRVNGRSTSGTAFFQKTGSMRADFERHLIARAVAFAAGENTLSLAGARVANRTLFLELRREVPLGASRYFALGVAAALVLAARGFAIARSRPRPRVRLAAAVLLYAFGLLALPAALHAVSGGHLAPLGEKDPIKTVRLRFLEDHLRSESHRKARAEKFSVFVMGDSTHYWSLPRKHWMVPVLNRALPEEVRDDVALYGLAGGALNAFDFYLLLNRIVREEPDLVVIPVGSRSFSEWWLHDEGYRFHGMDHYLGFGEFLRSWKLSVAGREITLVGWLLRRADASLFDGGVGHLLRGAKVFFEKEHERIRYGIWREHFASWAPVPAEAQLALVPKHPRWNTHIAEDHPLLRAYRLINGLAARHGIEVLYYSEQINEEAQREKGRELRVRENFAVIERAVAGAPGVHFLMLSDRNPREMFSDDIDHMTPDGIASVAAELAREIVARERAKRSGSR
jgi:hypothetical protein